MGRPSLPKEYFLTKAKLIHGNKYDYSKIEYQNLSTKIKIICPYHGEFYQLPHAHLSGEGCKKCQMGVFNFGILDISLNGNEESYRKWVGVIKRVKDPTFTSTHETYKDCSICDEWRYFSNFNDWFKNNYTNGYQLDKDILVKGNKIYSPTTCCFVPQEINKLLTKRNSKRGDLPIGVSRNKGKGKPFVASIRQHGHSVHLGRFDNYDDAFNVYKSAKEQYVKELAENYFQEGKITERVYQALMKYEVEITD
jgi:hypothetical protein